MLAVRWPRLMEQGAEGAGVKTLRYALAGWLMCLWAEAPNWIAFISRKAVLQGIVAYSRGVQLAKDRVKS